MASGAQGNDEVILRQVNCKYMRCWTKGDAFNSHFGNSAVSGDAKL